MNKWYYDFQRFGVFAIIFVAISCGNREVAFEGVDIDVWKEDSGGCEGLRAAMGGSLAAQRDKLLRLKEMEIVDLLGKPDENELYVRGQKIYRYYIDPAPSCGSGMEDPRILVLRFNALGVCHEAGIE